MLMDTRMRGWRASDGRLPVVESCWLAERTFRQDDVPAVRRFAEAFGARAGLRPARLADFVLAASEAVACATAWGPCVTRVRLWMTGRRAFCEVRGDACPTQGTGLARRGRTTRCGLQAALRRGCCAGLRLRVRGIRPGRRLGAAVHERGGG